MAKRSTSRTASSKRRNLAFSTLPGVGSLLHKAGKAYEKLRRNGCRKPVSQITDRAKRYRANQEGVRPGGPKKCAYCLSRANVGVHHMDGNEDNGKPGNLAWACKSCNGRIAAHHKRHGIGKRVAQMNPSKQSRKSMMDAYGAAVKVMRGEFEGDIGKAMDTINATPASVRSSFTSRSWPIRRERYGPSGRANPGIQRFKLNLGTRKNGEDAAAARYEYFHGRPPEKDFTISTPIHRHSVLSGIGDLKELLILSVTGDRKVRLEGFKGALLAETKKGTQLYIKGGDQSVNLKDFGITSPHDLEILGALLNVVYFTTKDHLMPADGGTANYKHKFGGEGRTKKYVFGKKGTRLPMVGYDVRNKLLSIQGGTYKIVAEGIDG